MSKNRRNHEEDIELLQVITNVCRDVFRGEFKWAAWIASGGIVIIGSLILFILTAINNKADLTNSKMDKFYDVVTEVKVLRSDCDSLKKKTDMHDVKINVLTSSSADNRRRLIEIENKIGNN